MTNRMFSVLNKCHNDSEEYGRPIENEIKNAYDTYKSMRDTLKGSDLDELKELLKGLEDYYKEHCGGELV